MPLEELPNDILYLIILDPSLDLNAYLALKLTSKTMNANCYLTLQEAWCKKTSVGLKTLSPDHANYYACLQSVIRAHKALEVSLMATRSRQSRESSGNQNDMRLRSDRTYLFCTVCGRVRRREEFTDPQRRPLEFRDGTNASGDLEIDLTTRYESQIRVNVGFNQFHPHIVATRREELERTIGNAGTCENTVSIPSIIRPSILATSTNQTWLFPSATKASTALASTVAYGPEEPQERRRTYRKCIDCEMDENYIFYKSYVHVSGLPKFACRLCRKLKTLKEASKENPTHKTGGNLCKDCVVRLKVKNTLAWRERNDIDRQQARWKWARGSTLGCWPA